MAVTRINNNQITDASTGNVYVGINASTKVQDYSITAGKIANSLVYGSDLTVSGNLTVNGQTTTIDTVSTVIEDPVIVLASNQTGTPAVDIGFIGERGDQNNIAFVWDESADEFVTAFTTDLVTNTTVTISSYANFHTNDANVGGNLAVGGNISITGNVTSLNVTGNITGGNLLTPGVVTATGNITGGNVSAGSGIISTTGNINGANINASSGITAGTTIISTGNITGGNIDTAGQVTATGNITGGNVSAGSGIISTTGNINGANINASAGITAGTTVIATGNVSGGNLTTVGAVTSATVTATGNVSGGNLTTAGITSTGSLSASTTINATGNITGGNLITAGLTNTGTLSVSSTSSFTGNITSAFNVTGNIAGGNISSPGQIVATGNITSGNLITTGDTRTGTLETTGNALIGGNLVVQGNISYINIDDLRVEDPIIILGTGPNGAPLTTDDGLDRGIFMEYYKTGLGNAFMGWDNSTGNMVIASNVNFTANDVVGVNSYGTLEAGNLYVQSAVSTGNVSGGNLTTAGQVVATGNVSGGNLTTSGLTSTGTLSVSSTSSFTGNITSAFNVTGNIAGGNLNTAGQVVATGNITGGNVSAGSGIISTTGNINGGNLNVTSRVAAATGYFTGNVDVLGNLNATVGVVYANSGIFLGDAVTGNNAAFAGIPGFTPLGTNVVMQFGGNVNSYSQLNFQNINNGTYASTDYIATADNGNDTSNYVNMGIASSTYDYPDFAGYEPTDAYLHNNGGNLLINPETAGKVVKFMIGGTASSDIVATMSNTAFAMTGNVSATTALIGGNITVQGSNINSNAATITVNSDSADTNFAVNGDTTANVFFVDAGTGTASFGTSTQTTNAVVAFNATNSVLMPVGNVAQRPGTGVTGMLRFNTTADALEVYDNAQWTTVGVPSFTVIADEQFNGDGTTVAFTLGSSQTTASCIVSINGVVQIPTIAYSVSGTTLTFTEAPEPGDIIDVREITTTTSVTSISNLSGNAAVGVSDTTNDVSVTGDLVVAGSVSASSFIGLDATTIANGTSSVSVIASGGNIRSNVGGATVQTISTGLVAITGDLSVTGNATLSGNILGDRIQNGTTQIDIQTPNGNANITIGGTSNVAVFSTTGANITGTLGVTGNITGGNLTTAGQVVATGNVNGGNLNVTGNIVDTGAMSLVTGASGNVNLAPNGSIVLIATTTGANITGTLNATGNANVGNLGAATVVATTLTGTLSTAAQTNITSVGTLSSLTVTANVAGGNLTTAGQVVATGNVNGGNLVATTAVSTSSIIKTGSNAVGNIGSSSNYFNTVFAQATSALYADLAEKYVADAEYLPGTVVVFGGDKEVTVSSTDSDRAVAGVVSTNPSYIMNGGLEAEHVATVALTGRVPCRVTGTVRKGDLMVSAGYGLARAEQDPRVGTVIGKALENHEGAEGVIEVVVGRF
jgi:filamentous hemagglutinin